MEDRALAGKVLFPGSGKPLNVEQIRALRKIGVMMAMAGGAFEAGMTAQPDPFGVSVDADGRVVVDDFTKDITVIPALIRDLTLDNQGYWIENIFNGGPAVQGGAVKYTMNTPDDHFLAADSLMPRAPGAEAPRVQGSRLRPTVAYPQSISASLEVTDEARLRNEVIQLQHTVQQIANTFVLKTQTLGETALTALVTAGNRVIFGGTGTFTDWPNSPVINSTSAMPYPQREFAAVQAQFISEMGGVMFDTLLLSVNDNMYLQNIYGAALQALLASFGITRVFVSPRRADGRRLYIKSGQVGYLLWELPLGDPEYVREGVRKTDVYVYEMRPVFVANGADAILMVSNTVS